MAKNCVNCGKSLGLFGGDNEIVAGSGRFFCDKCYRPFHIYVNLLRNISDVGGIVEARIKAKSTIEGSDLTQQVKKDALQDIDAVYKKRCEELQVDEAEIEKAEEKVNKEEEAKKEAERLLKEVERSRAERYIVQAEIVGTRMAENGSAGITFNSTSYSVLIFYSNGDVDLAEGDVHSIRPLLRYIKPGVDTKAILERIEKLEQTMKDYIAIGKS